MAKRRSYHQRRTKKQRTKDRKKRRLEASLLDPDAGTVTIKNADGTVVGTQPPYSPKELREMGLVPKGRRKRSAPAPVKDEGRA